MENIISETYHSIDYEKKFIELLGYSLIGPDKSNRWVIIDDNNNQVGFIQYKKLFNKNDKKGYPATFGYCTMIDSSEVSYKSTRRLNNIGSRLSSDVESSYDFDVKRENGDIDHVEISMGEFPNLNIWSKRYGFFDFKVNQEGLFLDYKSKTEKFNIEELVTFKSDREKGYKRYLYQIRYCDKKLELSNGNLRGTTIREISGSCQESNRLELSEKTWINGKLRTDRESEVIGTVEEMVVKHQMGIDSFNHFRFLINQILPFKQDVVSFMLNDEIVKERGLSLFISDLERGKKLKKEVKSN